MKHFLLMVVSIFVPFLTISSVAVAGTDVVYAETAYAKNAKAHADSFEKIEYKKVDRVENLRKFFRKYNSPLENSAETFVEVADKYGLDYRVLPAISGVESTFAQAYIPTTHNPFGWGGGLIAFNSFDDSIRAVGKGLNDIYLSKGRDTVEKIAPVYNPPHPDSWSRNVNYFMDQISSI